jgi:hypothetical protein
MSFIAAGVALGTATITAGVGAIANAPLKNAQKNLTNAQTEQVKEKTILDQFDSYAKYLLGEQQIQSQSETAKFTAEEQANASILSAGTTAQGQILSTSIQSSNSSLILITCIIGGVLLIGGGLYFITKKS